MERIAGLGWFVALIVVTISFALPYLWGDFGYSIASLLWEEEGALAAQPPIQDTAGRRVIQSHQSSESSESLDGRLGYDWLLRWPVGW